MKPKSCSFFSCFRRRHHRRILDEDHLCTLSHRCHHRCVVVCHRDGHRSYGDDHQDDLRGDG
jgi:hypothetical protein